MVWKEIAGFSGSEGRSGATQRVASSHNHSRSCKSLSPSNVTTMPAFELMTQSGIGLSTLTRVELKIVPVWNAQNVRILLIERVLFVHGPMILDCCR